MNDPDVRQMHQQNQKALAELTKRVDGLEQLMCGKKEDPEDNGLKGDMQGLKKGQKDLQKWVVRIGLVIIAILVITRYPELGKFILKLAE